MHIWFDFIKNMDVITRSSIAFIFSLLFVVITGNRFIRLIKNRIKIFQPIREDGPQEHLKKSGTPTLGGIIILIPFYLSCYLLIVDFNEIIKIILFVSFSFALLGLCDDLMKLLFKNSKGLSGKFRLIIGFIITSIAAYYLLSLYPPEISRSVLFPYIHSMYIYIGTFGSIIFITLVTVATANSVNLLDGLDGLASIIVSTILVFLYIVLYLMLIPGNFNGFNYSGLFYYNEIREVFVVIASLIGSLLGFLWYNAKPAKIFMGDVGSLGVGATLGIIAVILKQELFLFIAGLILVFESLSVIIQVYYYKFTGKRIFLMAPLHHHFEKKGYYEVKVVKRFWLFTIFTCIIATLLLDIR